jgi:hypothetical protein
VELEKLPHPHIVVAEVEALGNQEALTALPLVVTDLLQQLTDQM